MAESYAVQAVLVTGMITVANVETEHGEITVLKSRDTGSLLYSQGEAYQSEADSRGVSLAYYIHGIFHLLRQCGSRDVLMIGCGGGTLATMLDSVGVKVTLVDINACSFEIARRYFGLPDRVDCHVADGHAFILAWQHQYDALVLDAFVGDCIPKQFCTESFLRDAKARLDPEFGRFIANVHVLHDLDLAPDRFACRMSRVWRDVRMLDTRGATNRNALVMAGHVRHLRRPEMLIPPETGRDEIVSDLGRLAFRSWHLHDGQEDR